MNRYKIFLLVVFSVVWVWAAWEPLYFDGWLLENLLVFLFVPIILLTGRYFQLSNVSYTLITLFLILHVIGSHYTYAEVPFGFVLQDWLDANRNMYDRLVHFAFGLLLYYPLREMFARIAKVKGVWGYYVPLDVVAAFAGIFEILEWIVARKIDPAAGLAFLGTQGDIWDAQKDMLLAIIGALIALVITAIINWRYNHKFAQEICKSLKLLPNDRPLGEEALRKMINAKVRKSVQKIKDKKDKLQKKIK